MSHQQEDDKLLQQLFALIADDELDDGRRRDLVLFLKELCAFSQTLQQDSKNVFFKVSAAEIVYYDSCKDSIGQFHSLSLDKVSMFKLNENLV